MSNSKQTIKEVESPTCGIIMPISAIDGCSAEHWVEVKEILQESVDSIHTPKFKTKLVSDADEVGVIQKRIVQNIYNCDIVICDVSGRNANVMFELGMRLAFDKPTIIIKDDCTEYAFDTGIIEHIPYPRDLRFGHINSFKKRLSEKISATYENFQKDQNASVFLKHFGQFRVSQITESEISADKAVVSMLTDIQLEISSLRRQVTAANRRAPMGVLSDSGRDLSLIAKKVRDLATVYAHEHGDISTDKIVDLERYVASRIGPTKGLSYDDFSKMVRDCVDENL